MEKAHMPKLAVIKKLLSLNLKIVRILLVSTPLAKEFKGRKITSFLRKNMEILILHFEV